MMKKSYISTFISQKVFSAHGQNIPQHAFITCFSIQFNFIISPEQILVKIRVTLKIAKTIKKTFFLKMKWVKIKWETLSWFLVGLSLNPILKPQIEKKKSNQQSFGVLGNKKREIIICLDATLQPLSAFCFSSCTAAHDIGILPSNLFLEHNTITKSIPH